MLLMSPALSSTDQQQQQQLEEAAETPSSSSVNTGSHFAPGSGWEKTVETLVLNHRQISRVDSTTLEQFVNLRKLQLIDNSIVRIEGLGKCKLLEELSLEKNKITHIEGVNHLRYLKKLDLGRNRIRRIDGLN